VLTNSRQSNERLAEQDGQNPRRRRVSKTLEGKLYKFLNPQHFLAVRIPDYLDLMIQ